MLCTSYYILYAIYYILYTIYYILYTLYSLSLYIYICIMIDYGCKALCRLGGEAPVGGSGLVAPKTLGRFGATSFWISCDSRV